MNYPRLSFWFLFILNFLVSLTTPQQTLAYYRCSTDGNYTANSTYAANLKTLLSSISTTSDLFFNASIGQKEDQVYALAICRFTETVTSCRSCLNDSSQAITRACPHQKETFGGYDECRLRFSNRNILSSMEDGILYRRCNMNDAANISQFDDALAKLLLSLNDAAAAPQKYAAGEGNYTSLSKIYGMQQCTPDITEQECRQCLLTARNDMINNCYGKLGFISVAYSCQLQFELFQFFPLPADASPQPPRSMPAPPPPQFPPDTPGSGGNKSRTIIIIAISTAFAVLIAVLICLFLQLRKRKQNSVETVDEISSIESSYFDFGTIRAATNNFCDANKLGQGGFGVVYKGRLQNGKEIAVKRLSKGSKQGELEFKTEILLVAKLQHKNLVRLLGFCLEKTERLLIYEFVLNASLDKVLFDPIKRGYLDWDRRYKIIGGVARGLLYLHEDSRLRIIHRDLKASNILLDEEMNPKVADFGMARLFELDETRGNTKRIAGTYGYMAPEYAMHGQFSAKSDVFSFGVLVLEIVSGQKNGSIHSGEDVEHLPSYAWKYWREGAGSNLIDLALKADSGSIRDIIRCIHIGLLCVQKDVTSRPTMASVVLMLDSISITLPLPSEPAFFMHSSIDPELPLLSEYASGSKGSSQSISELNS